MGLTQTVLMDYFPPFPHSSARRGYRIKLMLGVKFHQKFLSFPQPFPHFADKLAIALCWLNLNKTRSLIGSLW